MRVLFVSNLYPPVVVGGYERLCFEVASAFAARGQEVWVLASNHGNAAKDYPGQIIRRTLRLLTGPEIYDRFPGDDAARDKVNRANLRALQDTLAEARPDVVFAWNLFFLDRSFLAALGACGRPVTCMLTDNWLLSMERPDYHARFFQDHVFGQAKFLPDPVPAAPVQGVPVPGLWTRLRAMIVPSSPPPETPIDASQPLPLRFPFLAVFGAAFVRDLYTAGGIVFERSRVVHNGVRQKQDGVPRNRLKLVREGELRLLFAGRLVDLKGAHDAVAAMPLLRDGAAGTNLVRLTLVGDTRDTAYAKRLHEAIAASGRADVIELRPLVPEDQLFELFQDHDIYLFPSLYEPFSLTLIHALACGIPTAATRAGGNVEIIQDGESGVLFEKNDPADLAQAVARLATNPALRATVSAGGQRAASRFTFESMVEGMEAALNDVV